MLHAHDLTLLDLRGRLAMPPAPIGLVVIPSAAGAAVVAAGARDGYLAAAVGRWGYATFVVDLLKPGEPAATRFDVNLLAARLAGVCKELGRDPRTASLAVAFLASETAAAAALVAAACKAINRLSQPPATMIERCSSTTRCRRDLRAKSSNSTPAPGCRPSTARSSPICQPPASPAPQATSWCRAMRASPTQASAS